VTPKDRKLLTDIWNYVESLEKEQRKIYRNLLKRIFVLENRLGKLEKGE
jgi:hypothetical protein